MLEELTPQEIERYSRQLILPEWSLAMQEHFKRLSVEMPTEYPQLALYLAAVGVGELRLTSESEAMRNRIRAFNPYVALCPASTSNTSAVASFSIAPQKELNVKIPQGLHQANVWADIDSKLVTLHSACYEKEVPLPTCSDKNLVSTTAALLIIDWWMRQFKSKS